MNANTSKSFENQIIMCSQILTNGGVAAYPTDTVYGLGACFDIDSAVEKLFSVKRRSDAMALPLLVSNSSWINEIAADISDLAWTLIENFMPGALTLIVTKSDRVSNLVSGGKSTVAVRIPAHPIALKLIETVGRPLTGTSANISGMPNTTTAEEVIAQFDDTLDYILDGGKTPGGVESTILDVTRETPILIRYGAIPVWKIEEVCKISIT